METRFGHDFSSVRVHADAAAAASARAMNALAYTVGQDIVFDAGRYAPGAVEGQRLLAHELAHVVQQQRGQATAQTSTPTGGAGDALEVAADRAAADVVAGRTVAPQAPAPPGIHRDKAPAAPSCSAVDLFTELSMPIYLPNNYFHGSTWMEKDKWKAALDKAKAGKCEAIGKFKGVKLAWDLGNPKLGSKFGVNLNKNDIKFDIIPHVLHSAKPCCACFSGTASWTFDVSISRTTGGKTETGKTKTPITGSVTGEKCDGKPCCAVDETLKVGIVSGDSEITANITGEVRLVGSTFGG